MNESRISTPIGVLEVHDDGEQILAVVFSNHQQASPNISPLAQAFLAQFEEYLAGTRKAYDIPYLITGTPFQKAVMIAMSRIPYGSTMSYGELARAAGYPNAYRAVGTVCATNALPFLLPCHRVIQAGGKMGLYGGGESLKRRLLDLEKA